MWGPSENKALSSEYTLSLSHCKVPPPHYHCWLMAGTKDSTQNLWEGSEALGGSQFLLLSILSLQVCIPASPYSFA